jgi:NitT/TauT family transport system permease protein
MAVTTAPGAPAAPTVRPPRRLAIPAGAVPFISLAAGLLAWQTAGSVFTINWLPPLHVVVAEIGTLWAGGELQAALAESLGNLVIGFLISSTAGVALGTLMTLFPKVNYALRPYVNGFLLAPSIVMAPVFFVFFGLSRATPIAVIVLYSVLFVTVNTQTALQQVDRSLLEMSRSLGASRWQTYRHIIVPAALPLLMAGLRLGMGRCVKGMINGEMFIAVVGLGRLDDSFEGAFDAAGILAIMLVVVVTAIMATGAVQLVDRRLNAWAYRSS